MTVQEHSSPVAGESTPIDEILHLAVCRWEEYQHYSPESGRRMVWCKFHTKLLGNRKWRSLPDDSTRVLFCGLLLLAAEYDNVIDNDPKWIADRIGMDGTPNLQALLDADLIEPAVLPASKQDMPASSMPASKHERLPASLEERRGEEILTSFHVRRSDAANPKPPSLPVRETPEGLLADVPMDLVREWERTFPGIDVAGCIRRAAAWVATKPKSRRKTEGGAKDFLRKWVSREHSRADGIRIAGVGMTPEEAADRAEAEQLTSRHRPGTVGHNEGSFMLAIPYRERLDWPITDRRWILKKYTFEQFWAKDGQQPTRDITSKIFSTWLYLDAEEGSMDWLVHPEDWVPFQELAMLRGLPRGLSHPHFAEWKKRIEEKLP